MSKCLIEIAEESLGWAVRVGGAVNGAFAEPSAAVSHAHSLSEAIELTGVQTIVRVYLTPGGAPRSRAH